MGLPSSKVSYFPKNEIRLGPCIESLTPYTSPVPLAWTLLIFLAITRKLAIACSSHSLGFKSSRYFES
jgi:hypothetical protein